MFIDLFSRNASSRASTPGADPFLASTQHEADVLVGRVTRDDPRLAELQKRIDEKKPLQRPLPIAQDIIDPERLGYEFGLDLAEKEGGQFVFVGEAHKHTDQWKTLAWLIEGLAQAGDQRRIIIVNEYTDNTDYGSAWRAWNDTSIAKREKLGDVMLAYNGFKSYEDMTRYYKNADNKPGSYATNRALFDALNRISQARPDANFYNVDVNSPIIIDGKPYDKRFAGRDTAMSYVINILKKRFPNAIIIGRFGYQHVIERMYKSDNAQKVDSLGVNLARPMAMQIAALYGDENVHTLSVSPGIADLEDSRGRSVPSSNLFYDRLLQISRYDKEKPWVDPWKDFPMLAQPPLLEDIPSYNNEIPLDPLKADDPKILAFMKDVEARINKQLLPTPAVDKSGLKRASQEIAQWMAEGASGRMVSLGKSSDQTRQWDVLVHVIQAYNKLTANKNRRQIIFAFDGDTRDSFAQAARVWNSASADERKGKGLGDLMVEANTDASVQNFREELRKKILGDSSKNILPRWWLSEFLPMPQALNELSRLAPSLKAYAINNNGGANLYSYNDQGEGKNEGFNPLFASVDSAQAYNLQILREKYPDAIIIAMVDYVAGTERTRDNEAKPENISKFGYDLNNSTIERISLLNDENKVLSVRVKAPTDAFGRRDDDNYIYLDFNQFDKVVTIDNFIGDWAPSW